MKSDSILPHKNSEDSGTVSVFVTLLKARLSPRRCSQSAVPAPGPQPWEPPQPSAVKLCGLWNHALRKAA